MAQKRIVRRKTKIKPRKDEAKKKIYKTPITLVYSSHGTGEHFKSIQKHVEKALKRAKKQGRIPLIVNESIMIWSDIKEIAKEYNVSMKEAYNALNRMSVQAFFKVSEGNYEGGFEGNSFNHALCKFASERKIPMQSEQLPYKIWAETLNPKTFEKHVQSLQKAITEKDLEKVCDLTEKHSRPRDTSLVKQTRAILRQNPKMHVIITRGTLHAHIDELFKEAGFKNIKQYEEPVSIKVRMKTTLYGIRDAPRMTLKKLRSLWRKARWQK